MSGLILHGVKSFIPDLKKIVKHNPTILIIIIIISLHLYSIGLFSNIFLYSSVSVEAGVQQGAVLYQSQ